MVNQYVIHAESQRDNGFAAELKHVKTKNLLPTNLEGSIRKHIFSQEQFVLF